MALATAFFQSIIGVIGVLLALVVMIYFIVAGFICAVFEITIVMVKSSLKYIVFLINFCFFVTGCTILSSGAYIQMRFDLSDDIYLISSIIFVIVGCKILVVGFVWIYGAYSENGCILYTNAILTGLILGVQIELIIAVWIFNDDVRELISRTVIQGMEMYSPQDHAGVKEMWDIIQSNFKCCGVESFRDWKSVKFSRTENIPDSCCITFTDNCGNNILDKDYTTAAMMIYPEGCLFRLEFEIINNVAAVTVIVVGILAFQFLAVTFSCFLATKIRRNKLSSEDFEYLWVLAICELPFLN